MGSRVRRKNTWNYNIKMGWGAVFSGLLVAFVITLILNALGLAVAVTGDGQVGSGMAIWSVIVAFGALFVGGWVMAREESAPQDKIDLTIHGTVLWGVLTFGLLFLAVNGIRFGLDAFISAATSVADQVNTTNFLGNLEELGLTDQQMEEIRDRVGQITPSAASSAWWSFIALVISLAATIAGAFVGGRTHDERVGFDVEHESVPRAS